VKEGEGVGEGVGEGMKKGVKKINILILVFQIAIEIMHSLHGPVVAELVEGPIHYCSVKQHGYCVP
jgi:hypothetical protein